MKELIINHFFNYEFIYIFLFCFFMFLSLSMFIKQKIIRKISILFVSLFFSLFVFETALSLFTEKFEETKVDNKILNIVHSKEIIKYRNIRFLDKKTNRKIFFTNDNIDEKFLDNNRFIKYIDAEYSRYKNTSFRYTKCNEQSKETYAFLGCSFTFGDGLNDDETLPYYFSKSFDFKCNVLNYGLQGKSSNSALNILNIGLPKDKEYKHFFYYLISEQILRNLIYVNTCFDGYIYIKGNFYKTKYPFSGIVSAFQKSYIFRKIFIYFIYKYNKKYCDDYMIESLKEMNRIIEEKYNSKLTIIVYPNKYSKRFIKKINETNLNLIYLPGYFNSEKKGYRIKNDGHPTAKANEEIAQILYNYINDLKQRNL